MKKAKELKDILICRILRTDVAFGKNDNCLYDSIFNFRTTRPVICLAENCVEAEQLDITAEQLISEIQKS